MEAVECRWRAAMRLGACRLWDLSLASDLILLVHSQGGVLCELPRKNLVFCGEANYGLECVSAAMMSGQGLRQERLKGATTGQNM